MWVMLIIQQKSLEMFLDKSKLGLGFPRFPGWTRENRPILQLNARNVENQQYCLRTVERREVSLNLIIHVDTHV